MADRTRMWWEGVVAGLWGAGGVALWFLVVDLLQGTPLSTPEMLGRALWSVLGKGIGLPPLANIIGYTLVHVLAFTVVGVVLSVVVDVSGRVPGVLAGLLLLFVVFEVGFYGVTALLSQSPEWGALAWYHIGLANLLAAALMGRYLWRQHPELGPRMVRVLDGRV